MPGFAAGQVRLQTMKTIFTGKIAGRPADRGQWDDGQCAPNLERPRKTAGDPGKTSTRGNPGGSEQ